MFALAFPEDDLEDSDDVIDTPRLGPEDTDYAAEDLCVAGDLYRFLVRVGTLYFTAPPLPPHAASTQLCQRLLVMPLHPLLTPDSVMSRCGLGTWDGRGRANAALRFLCPLPSERLPSS
jgi:hypothetical protein